MEVPLALMNALIMLYLFSTVWGRFEGNRAVSPMSPRRAFIRKPFRNANSHEMHFRGMAHNTMQYPHHHTMDPNVGLLARCNKHAIHTLQRIEAKFDHILNTVDFAENVKMRDIRDMTKKLNLIHQYISGPSEKDIRMNSPSENEMSSNRELVAAVGYSNEIIRKLATKFDQVIENGRLSLQSLNKVAEIVENINERTTRIQQAGTQNFSEDEIIGCGNPETRRSKYEWKDNEISKPNRNSPTSSNKELKQNGKVGHNRKNSTVTIKRITYVSKTNHHRQNPTTMNDEFNENESNTYNREPATSSGSDHEMDEENTAEYEKIAPTASNRANRFGTTDRVVETTSTSNNHLNENESGDGRKVVAIKTSNNKMSKEDIADYDYSAAPATATQNRALSEIGKTNRVSAPGTAISSSSQFNKNESDSRNVEAITTTNDDSDPPAARTSNRKLNGIGKGSNAVTTTNSNRFHENESHNRYVDEHERHETTSTSDKSVPSATATPNSNGIGTTSHVATTTATSINKLTKNEGGDGVDEHETTSTKEMNEHDTADNKRDLSETATQNEVLNGIATTSHATVTVTTSNNKFNENEGDGIEEHETTSTNETNEHFTTDNSAPPETAFLNLASNGIVTKSHAVVTTTSSNNQHENESDGIEEHETTSTNEMNEQVTADKSAPPATATPNLNEVGTTSHAHNALNQNAPITTSNNGSIEHNNVSQNASTTTRLLFSHKPKTEHKRIPKAKYRDVRKVSDGVRFEPNKRNCQDLSLKMNGMFKFGSQDEVANDAGRFFNEQYCDFNTNDKAWTVIQRRFAPLEDNFNMTWTDYKLGFGDLEHGFWFGNEFIHKLTSDYDMELRILLEDARGPIDWIEYSQFKMESEKHNYKLVVDGHHGTFEDIFQQHDNQGFSTYDRSNNQGTSCASSTGMGWWFKDCTANTWTDWKGRTKILIRPKAFSEHKKTPQKSSGKRS